MSQLGHALPDHLRQPLIDSHLEPGQVLYLSCHFTVPPKPKFLVLVHHGSKSLMFFINSKVSLFMQQRPWLQQCQVQLKVADYDFLRHDSFLDCSEVIAHFDEAGIRSQLEDDLTRAKGPLSPADLGRIVSVVQAATTISPADKRLIINSLQT